MRGIIVGTLIVLAACGDNGGSDAPEIAGASITTDEDVPIMHAVQATAPDGGALTLQAQAPMHGTVAVDRLNVVYTPAVNYHGPDSFTVTVSNGKEEASAQIDVTVRPVNDEPTAAADSFALDEDTPLVRPVSALLANDTDVDGDTLTLMSVQGANNGTVASAGNNVTFTPAANFNGMASFRYTVSDGAATSTTTVTIAVGGLNDPPVAAGDTVAAQEDTPVDVTAATLLMNDTDAESQTLTLTGVANPTNGTVALAGGTITFTPGANFNGAGSFEYTVSDGSANATGVVTVNVASVNDLPVAGDDSAATDEDTPLQLPASGLLTNDADVDGQTLTVTAAGPATNGTVALAGGVVTFTPAANFNGAASFDYTISDGTATDTGTVTITVNAVNDPPLATDDTTSTAEDTPLVIAATTLLANDSDVEGQTITLTQAGGAVNGTVDLAGGNITFTPAANFNGAASFTYTISDGVAIDTGVVTVNVAPVNDPPVATDDSALVTQDDTLVLQHATLLDNDTDVDGQTLTITTVQNAVNGTAVLGAGTITFTPPRGFLGAASFEYVISDGTATDVAVVRIDVVACGDGVVNAAETCDDGNTTAGDGCSAACAIEPGWTCSGQPSACTEICGDTLVVGDEQCDDGNLVDTDGCTSRCVLGVLCTATALPGGDRFAVDPATGHCYASFDDEMTTFGAAQAACVAAGGYLVTIGSAGEQTIAHSVQNAAQNPWIGASEDANDTDTVFDWVTDESFTFASFAAGQPDDDAGSGGNGDCLHMFNAAGEWNDTNCNIDTFVVGRICEVEPAPCGDSVLQPRIGEECDDSNNTSGDGCSATCLAEDGCGDGNLDAGEECDDDNIAGGDGCSATCQFEDGCGDGNLDTGEECDDDNTAGGDGCSATCQIENGCGDGNLDAGEECDDDNTAGGDGCSATCQLEDGCGDGNLDTGEECDDDNTAGGDGCSATCERELAVFFFNNAAGNEVTFPASFSATGLASVPAIGRGSGLTATLGAGAFNASGFTLTAVLDPTDYFTITVAPAAGRTLSLRRLELDERRSATGIRNWSVRSSLDGFATDLGTFAVPDDTNTRSNQQIPLGAAFQNLAAPVEFRIYGFTAEGSGGTWRVDNVELYGFTTP